VDLKSFLKKSSWPRDILIGALIIAGVIAYQNRNLLDDDGSIQISPQNFVQLNGDMYSLQPSDKKTLIYFFAPWCTVCKMSISNLDVVDTKNYNVVRIALDYQSVEEIEAFAKDAEVEGTILLGGLPHKQRFNITGYPTYYILNEDLQVIKRDMGYSTSLGLSFRTLAL
jgi:thiol-disulfide isomerase/thioredoxin